MSKRTGAKLFLFAGSVIGLIFGWEYLTRSARSKASTHHCEQNLRKIVQALFEYHEKHGSYPAATLQRKNGEPRHSWRVAILPFLEHQDLYDEYHFDEPWNGPNNSRLIERMPLEFGCPGDSGKPKGNANYVAIIGSQTCWPGPFALKRSDIIDASSQTIQLMEIDHSDIAWLEPRDITLRDLIPLDTDGLGPRFSSPHPEVVNVALCDTSVRGLKKSVDRKILMTLLTPAGGRPYHGKWLPGEVPVLDATFPPEI